MSDGTGHWRWQKPTSTPNLGQLKGSRVRFGLQRAPRRGWTNVRFHPPLPLITAGCRSTSRRMPSQGRAWCSFRRS